MPCRSPAPAAFLVLATLAAAPACGGGDDDDGDTIDAGDEERDGGAAADYVELIGADYEIPPGGEPYRCVRLTMTEDVWVTGFVDQSPLGTHHTVLSVGDPSGEDRAFDCDVGANRTLMMFASGVGSDAFDFPPGVAVRIAAGQQLNLNVHLYNASPDPISGRAGVKVRTIPAEEAAGYEQAELILAGPVGNLVIDDAEGVQKISGACPITRDGTILNLWPHMHKLGTHMTIRHNDVVKLDEPYDFEEQINWPTVFEVSAGDSIHVECSFVNDTGAEVRWGESSDEEMCFAGFYRYPVVGGGICTGF